MTSVDDEKCRVYLRVYLGNEDERMCEKGHGLPSSAIKHEPGSEIRWSLVFYFNDSLGLRYEAFLKNGAVLLGLSYVSPDQMMQWRLKKELVKISDMILSSDNVFQAFEKIAPKGEWTQPAGLCNIWVVKLMEELHIHLPEKAVKMAFGNPKGNDSRNLEADIKQLRFLFKDKGLLELPVDRRRTKDRIKQKKQTLTAENRHPEDVSSIPDQLTMSCGDVGYAIFGWLGQRY